jgi:uroporphyrinogen-III synthase
MRSLVILRPEPGASVTADAARHLGLEPILMPLFRIEPIAWTVSDLTDFDGLLLTSANAVRAGERELRKCLDLPAHAVGEATASAARQEGFRVETVGSSGVDSLLASLSPNLRLLHPCGADRREPRSAAQTIIAIPVYRSAELPLPDNFHALEGSIVVVHSPRAAARLADLARHSGLARKSIAIAAISPEAAAAVGAEWQQVESADNPDERALLALAARLCHNSAQ